MCTLKKNFKYMHSEGTLGGHLRALKTLGGHSDKIVP